MYFRKLIAALLSLMLGLSCVSALAENSLDFGIDLTQASDEELAMIIEMVKAEQRSRVKTAISLDLPEVSVAKGKTQKVTATVIDLTEGVKAGKFAWTSSDESVATCNNGTIKAVGAGSAVITCTNVLSDGTELSAQCVVTVYVPIQGLTLETKNAKLYVNSGMTLKVSIKPEDATHTELVFSSSDENVATVSDNGTVRAVGVGKAKITAASTDGSNKTAVFDLTVVQRHGYVGREITYHGIPWGSSIEEANQALKANDGAEELTAPSAGTSSNGAVEMLQEMLIAAGYNEDEVLAAGFPAKGWNDESVLIKLGAALGVFSAEEAKEMTGIAGSETKVPAAPSAATERISQNQKDTSVILFPELSNENVMEYWYLVGHNSNDLDSNQKIAFAITSTPDYTVLGHEISQIRYSFAYEYEGGVVDPSTEHLYDVTLNFKWSDGTEAIKQITQIMGTEPHVSSFRDALATWRAYLWTGDNGTALMAITCGGDLTQLSYDNYLLSRVIPGRIRKNKETAPDNGI